MLVQFINSISLSHCKASQGTAEPPRPPAPAVHPHGTQRVGVRTRPSTLPSSTPEEQTNTSDLPHMSNPTITNRCMQREKSCLLGKKPNKTHPTKQKKQNPLGFMSRGAGAPGQVQQPPSSTDPRPKTAPHLPRACTAHLRDKLYPLQLSKRRASLPTLPPAATPGPSLNKAHWEEMVPTACPGEPHAPPAAHNSCLLKVRQAKRLNAWLPNDRMTLALIRGSNYLENGGHGPRSFTLIEFQYLPLAAWAPGCDLKQLIKAEHLPHFLSLTRIHQLTSQPAGKV